LLLDAPQQLRRVSEDYLLGNDQRAGTLALDLEQMRGAPADSE